MLAYNLGKASHEFRCKNEQRNSKPKFIYCSTFSQYYTKLATQEGRIWCVPFLLLAVVLIIVFCYFSTAARAPDIRIG